MAAIITWLISFEKIWLRVVSAMTGNPPLGGLCAGENQALDMIYSISSFKHCGVHLILVPLGVAFIRGRRLFQKSK